MSEIDELEIIQQQDEEIDALKAEVERLRASVDRLLWNLAGCSTIACSKTPTEFNREWAKPALHEVNELAKEYQDLKAEVERLRKSRDEWQETAAKEQQAKYMAEAENERLRKSLEGEVHAAVVDDACMSFRHDYGLLSDSEKASTIFQAMEWLKAWGRAILEPSAATRKALGEAGKKEEQER